MNNLPKEFVVNTESNVLLTAAELSGWKVSVTHGKADNLSVIEKGNQKIRVHRGNTSLNDAVAVVISGDKYKTHVVLQPITPYVTQPTLFKIDDLTDSDIQSLLEKYKKLVVKPVDENNGIGITTSLTTLQDVKEAVQRVKTIGSSDVLIENHVETVNEYRVITWKGKVVDILRRIPAYVIGNGKDSIEQLIIQKNTQRTELFSGLFDLISIDDNLTLQLKKVGLNLQSVLEDGKYFTLKSTCNLSQGGETERIDITTIHPEFHTLFKQVYEATALNYCGIDLISPNLTSMPIEGKTAINELNGAPAFTVAFFADLMTNQPFFGAKKLLSAIEQDPL